MLKTTPITLFMIVTLAACQGGLGGDAQATDVSFGEQFQLGNGTYFISEERLGDGSTRTGVVVAGSFVPCDGTVPGCMQAVEAHLRAS